MCVQGKVDAAQPDIGSDEGRDPPEELPGERGQPAPEEPVMDQEEVGAALHRGTDGGLRRIHRHHQVLHFGGPLHLEAVECRRGVRMSGQLQVGLQILEDVF